MHYYLNVFNPENRMLEDKCTNERVNSLEKEPKSLMLLTQGPLLNPILSHHSQIHFMRTYLLKKPMYHTKKLCSRHGDNAPCFLYVFLISLTHFEMLDYSGLLDLTNPTVSEEGYKSQSSSLCNTLQFLFSLFL